MAINPKILFILKRREDYNSIIHKPEGMSTGLYNSANYVNKMLLHEGMDSVMEVAIDNNCIDRLVTKHKPTHVIIEALWVVPSKFAELIPLHPNVKWIIRLHSELPFMAGEGVAMNWLGDYVTFPQINIGINAPRMLEEIRSYLSIKNNWNRKQEQERVIYLPNYYPQLYNKKKFNNKKEHIDVACFGAVRLLKNHLLQAVSALKFADSIGKKLHFHINGDRIEMKGDPVLHNIKGLFMQLTDTGHKLILHQWKSKDDFLKICAEMDIGMQCNFSETFNIVSADLISQGVPIIGSEEIPWSSFIFNAAPSHSDSICNALYMTYKLPYLNVLLNQNNLTIYTNKTRQVWLKYFKQYAQNT
jgi:hypothetical protein